MILELQGRSSAPCPVCAAPPTRATSAGRDHVRFGGIRRRADPRRTPAFTQIRRCHRALGCRHYGLFDFRVDPAGRPWFIEAGLYCSFSDRSVLATMAAAAGIGVEDLYRTALQGALSP